jgi:outer membrane lipoprotein carrier protein
MRVLLFLSFYLLHAIANAASGMEQLNRFHNDVSSIDAEFYQVLKDASDNKVQESSGKVWIKRPGLFRWEYNDPYPQVIVADGERIWIYDPELDQVTIKQENSAIGNAPSLVLSGKYPLSRDFKLTEVDRGDQYQWVSLVPRQEDSDFAEISVAFLNDALVMLELKDNLGQRTQIHFKSQKINSVIDASKFRFSIPPGTDVIGGDQL